MLERMEGITLQKDLESGANNLEGLNRQIENSTNIEEKEGLFRKAEQIENELSRLEELTGINKEEIASIYEIITPEDATAIVEKTIANMNLEDKTLCTVDNLGKSGGKLIGWALAKSPKEAAIIIASAILLAIGGGQALAGENARQENLAGVEITTNGLDEAGNEIGEQEMTEGIEMSGPVKIMKGRGLFKNASSEYYNTQQAGSGKYDFTVNGKPVKLLKENKEEIVLGNDESIYSDTVHVGAISIKK